MKKNDKVPQPTQWGVTYIRTGGDLFVDFHPVFSSNDIRDDLSLIDTWKTVFYSDNRDEVIAFGEKFIDECEQLDKQKCIAELELTYKKIRTEFKRSHIGAKKLKK